MHLELEAGGNPTLRVLMSVRCNRPGMRVTPLTSLIDVVLAQAAVRRKPWESFPLPGRNFEVGGIGRWLRDVHPPPLEFLVDHLLGLRPSQISVAARDWYRPPDPGGSVWGAGAHCRSFLDLTPGGSDTLRVGSANLYVWWLGCVSLYS